MAYAAVLEHGSVVDNGLFVMLARGSALTLLTGGGSDATALEQFGNVLGQWEDLGNERPRAEEHRGQQPTA